MKLDAFDALLQGLRITGASYCRTDLAKPWGIGMPAEEGIRFHFVVSGACWLRVPGQRAMALATGDAVLLPHGTKHSLSDAPRGRARPILELSPRPMGDETFRVDVGAGRDRSVIVCCTVAFAAQAALRLVALMPEVLVVRRENAGDAHIATLLDMMGAEVREQRFGSATIMARIADIIIARVIRTWAESDAAPSNGLLAALRDPRIGRAVTEIHRRPEHPWTLAALGKLAGLSRSAFAERFSRVVGTPLGSYLAAWRMHLAQDWLRDEGLSIADVAERSGYASEASFSRAFKRHHGITPGAVTRGREPPSAS